MPESADVIAPENVDRLEELARWGEEPVFRQILFSPDGEYLAANTDYRVFLHRGSDLSESLSLEAPDVRAMAFSPDGRVLATAFKETTLLWSIPDGERLGEIAAGAVPGRLVFSPDGSQLLVSGCPACDLIPSEYGWMWRMGGPDEAIVQLWEVGGGTLAGEVDFEDTVFALAFVAGEPAVLTGPHQVSTSYDPTVVTLRRFPDAEALLSLEVLRGVDEAMGVFSPDGAILLTGGWTIRPPDAGEQVYLSNGLVTTKVQAWQAADGRPLATYERQFVGPSPALSHDGTTLATQSERNSVVVWRGTDMAIELPYTFASGLVLSPDGDLLAVLSTRGIDLWRVDDGTLVASLERRQQGPIAFAPDGEMGVMQWGEAVDLLNLADGQPVGSIALPVGSKVR